MIDPQNDELITFTDVTRLLPPLPGGKRTNRQTVYVWTRRGCRGVVLESIDVAARSYTTKAALDSFLAEVALRRGAGRAQPTAVASGPASPKSRLAKCRPNRKSKAKETVGQA